ncbi:MAG: hypothetical protein NVSMB51_00120 [Solirubrobacteraceae bacterium]
MSTHTQVSRTLVKSAPELWAEVSDAAALSRHLGEFGEIRITRTEPENTVAWEGERASGTVKLEVSGWGTKVMLTARAARPGQPVGAPALAQPDVSYPAPTPPSGPAVPTARPGFFKRLFGRRALPLEPPPPAPACVPASRTELRALGPIHVVEQRPPEPIDASGALETMLDTLGTAHRRPFSRG